MWLNRDKVYAAIIQNGTASEIIDSEFDIIQQEVIDDVSHQINDEFDFLYSYECKKKLNLALVKASQRPTNSNTRLEESYLFQTINPKQYIDT